MKDACAGVTCGGKGTCTPSNFAGIGYTCECDDGYFGDKCEVKKW